MRARKDEIKKRGIDTRGALKKHFGFEHFRPVAERDWIHRGGRSEAATAMEWKSYGA
jgi:hypothetical protein